MPDPPRRRPSWRRPTILLLMVAIALVAVALGVVKHRRDVAAREMRLALLKSDLARATDRARWSQKMQEQGYVSAAQAKTDRIMLETAKAELKAFEGR